MKLLHELPPEHPDRNRPLAGVRYRWRGSKGAWSEVKPTFRIARNTYNELGPAWVEHDHFTWDTPPRRSKKDGK